MNRPELQAKLNDLNEKFNTTRVQMEKSGASLEQMQRLRDMAVAERKRLIEEHGDDLAQLGQGGKKIVHGGTFGGAIMDDHLPDMSKVINLGKENMWRKGASKLGDVVKKASGGLKAVPILGTALGVGSAISSKDAAAALPILGDVEGAGEGSDTGMYSPEEEQMTEAFRQSREEDKATPSRWARMKQVVK